MFGHKRKGGKRGFGGSVTVTAPIEDPNEPVFDIVETEEEVIKVKKTKSKYLPGQRLLKTVNAAERKKKSVMKPPKSPKSTTKSPKSSTKRKIEKRESIDAADIETLESCMNDLISSY